LAWTKKNPSISSSFQRRNAETIDLREDGGVVELFRNRFFSKARKIKRMKGNVTNRLTKFLNPEII